MSATWYNPGAIHMLASEEIRGRQLEAKVKSLEAACKILGLEGVAGELAGAWQAFPPVHTANPFAVERLRRAIDKASEKVEARAPARAANETTRAVARALAQPVPDIAPLAAPARSEPPSQRCEDCGGGLRGDAAQAVCARCGREQRAAEWAAEDAGEAPARGEVASHEKSAALYVRRLQGHGRDPIELQSDEREALLAGIRRARVTGRNVTVRWMRSLLQETRLTHLNDRIPAIMSELLRVDIPQLSGEEERTVINRINNDIRNYLAMKQTDSPTGRRQNALPCAYLAYRHLDALIYPADPRRQLLALIHLQERRTFEQHENSYWRLCRLHRRPFHSLGLPPSEPFKLRAPAAANRQTVMY